MKTLINIMKNELKMLFCSPISWLILVIFAFQVNMAFCDKLAQFLRDNVVGYSFYDLEGVFMSPSIGIKSSINDNLALNFQLGYSAQRFNYIEYDDIKNSYIHSVKLSLGIEW